MATTRYVWGKYSVSNSSPTFSYQQGGNFESYCFIHKDYVYQDGYDFVHNNMSTATAYYGYTITPTGNVDGHLVEVTIKNPKTIKLGTGEYITIPKGYYFATEPTCWVIDSYLANILWNLEDEYSYDEPDYNLIDEYASELRYNLCYESDDWWKYNYTLCRYADDGINQLIFGDSWSNNIDNIGGQSFATATFSQSQGSLISYVSSDSRYTYPDDDVSGLYWYEYKTSGYIDPTAVSLTTTPTAGSTATISVTPRSNSYGTVSYLYQYAINGSTSYTTITTSSSTTCNFTVPSNASSVMVRVRAQDNIGFTSTTYVTSSSYTVNKFTNYAGVSGTVKGVSPKVCVGGSIKTNVTVKKGVNGTVK